MTWFYKGLQNLNFHNAHSQTFNWRMISRVCLYGRSNFFSGWWVLKYIYVDSSCFHRKLYPVACKLLRQICCLFFLNNSYIFHNRGSKMKRRRRREVVIKGEGESENIGLYLGFTRTLHNIQTFSFSFSFV